MERDERQEKAKRQVPSRAALRRDLERRIAEETAPDPDQRSFFAGKFVMVELSELRAALDALNTESTEQEPN